MIDLHFGESFPRVGFIVTNLTAEQWIKEGKQAVKMTRLSCHRFRANEVRSITWDGIPHVHVVGNWRRDHDEFLRMCCNFGGVAGSLKRP
jgi:hypothetical protein